jgi:FkbM family methyltransferase
MNVLGSARGWALNRVRRHVRSKVRRAPALGLEKIGTKYGGWIVPTALIQPTWRCYDGGVGEDVSFDLGLIDRLGCTVHAFDPTPRAIAYAEPIAMEQPKFRFMPVGLWSSDTSLRFYAPKDPAHVSHSALNLQGTDKWFEAACRSIPSLMRELDHPAIELLKLDIEGAEHRVIASLLDAGIRPLVLCFEVDQPVGVLRFWRTMRRVLGHGYDLVAVDNWNYTFVRRDVSGADVPKS